MKLYYTPGVCSLSPHIALREAGLKFTLEKVDLSTKKTASGKDFYNINPKGYVPVLELDNGEILTEGVAILQYLAGQRPDAGLLPPTGTFEHIRALEWLVFISTELHKGYSPFFKGMGDQAWEIAQKNLSHHYGNINKLLEKQKYLMGDTFTVADGYLYTVTTWAKAAKFDLSKWPALQVFMARIAERPSVRTALEAEGLRAAAA